MEKIIDRIGVRVLFKEINDCNKVKIMRNKNINRVRIVEYRNYGMEFRYFCFGVIFVEAQRLVLSNLF